MDLPASPREVNRHGAQAPDSMEPSATTQAMSPAHGHVNMHSGQHFGHAAGGRPTSEVSDGGITVPGASHNDNLCDNSVGTHLHGREHHHHHHLPHHTPDGSAVNDPTKDFVHDGTTYATGATGEPYTDDDIGTRPGVMTRIKEAVPGTREHKQKTQQEDGLAVYM